MADGVGKNLKNVLIAFNNVLGKLLRQYPFIFICCATIIGFGLYFFTKSEARMTFGLCVLISFASILIYARTKNYAETLLSFMLGVLTIFTIEWNKYTSLLFIGFYLSVNVVIFFIRSIQLGIKLESELTTAAVYIDMKNFDSTYKQINKISKLDTKYNALGEVERAEAIKYLAYMKIPVSSMKLALDNIDLIKVVYQVDLKKACDYYKSLFFIQQRTKAFFSITNLLNQISERRLPLSPEEFLEILQKTKKELIKTKFPLTKYLDLIDISVAEGEDIDGIVACLKEKLNPS